MLPGTPNDVSLTADERDALASIGSPLQPSLPREMAERLVALGLIEQRLGGYTLTQDGMRRKHKG